MGLIRTVSGINALSNGDISSDFDGPLTRFQGHSIFEVQLLRKSVSLSRSCYITIIGKHTQSIEWYHFQWPSVTSDPDFKVATFFDIENLRNDTRQSHSYCRTSIESDMRSIE